MRVLIVEDLEDLAEILAAILEEKGCQPRVALSGQEAIRYLKSESFDLILSDFHMPVMNGAEFRKTILQQNLSSAPFVLYTSDPEAVQASMTPDQYDLLITKGRDNVIEDLKKVLQEIRALL